MRGLKNTFGIVPEVRLGKKMTYLIESGKLTITSWSGVPKYIPLTDSTSVEPLTDSSFFNRRLFSRVYCLFQVRYMELSDLEML